MCLTEREDAAATSRPGLSTASAYCAGAGADVSVCQSPNSFPCGSLQVENQPMAGTGIGSFSSPPSSRTRPPPALMSAPAEYARVPRLAGVMVGDDPPCSPPTLVRGF